MNLYATQNKLFGFFGRQQGDTAADSVISLSLDAFPPVWTNYAAPGLPWRYNAAFVGARDFVYFVGGRPIGTSPTTLGAPQAKAQAFDLFNRRTIDLPDLPQAVSGASAEVLDHKLYVIGGTTTGANADATAKVYRLNLTSEDRPQTDATWAEVEDLPAPMRGTAAVVGGDKLYVLGGQVADGSRRENIWTYDMASDSWSRAALMPGLVSDGGAVDLAGSIWYFGGLDADGKPTKAAYRFDYSSNPAPVRAFPNGPPNLPAERAFPGVAVAPGDAEHGPRLFVVGGEKQEANGAALPVPELHLGDTL
jgi:hypothetical protein